MAPGATRRQAMQYAYIRIHMKAKEVLAKIDEQMKNSWLINNE